LLDAGKLAPILVTCLVKLMTTKISWQIKKRGDSSHEERKLREEEFRERGEAEREGEQKSAGLKSQAGAKQAEGADHWEDVNGV
jgi:hypothetical protein